MRPQIRDISYITLNELVKRYSYWGMIKKNRIEIIPSQDLYILGRGRVFDQKRLGAVEAEKCFPCYVGEDGIGYELWPYAPGEVIIAEFNGHDPEDWNLYFDEDEGWNLSNRTVNLRTFLSNETKVQKGHIPSPRQKENKYVWVWERKETK